jgi:hypothetical protein
VLFFHMVVAGGVVLLAIGVASLQSSHPMANALVLVKVGVSILAISWGMLVIGAALSVMSAQNKKAAVAHQEGSIVCSNFHFSFSFERPARKLTYFLSTSSSTPFASP